MIFRRGLYYYSKKQVRTLSYWQLRNWYANLIKPKQLDPPFGHVVQIGDPKLRSHSKDVPLDSVKDSEVKVLIACMKYVFNKHNCVGLSAPQVGVDLRLFIMEFNESHAKQFSAEEFKHKEMSLLPFTIVINPQVKITSYNKLVYSESCESIKGFFADVPRYRSLQLTGFDENGERICIDTTGWNARIIQHEVDHLNGKLYTDVMDRKTLTCTCWEAVNERRGKVVLPYSPH